MAQSGSLRSGVAAEVPPDLAVAARLGGEMGRRVVSFDWDSHPLGHPATWPTEIRTVLATSLVSRFPVVLWIGEDLSLIYNDGYIPMLGQKHPGALGTPARDVWREIWDVVGPMLDGVVRTGVPTWSDDLMLMLESSGRPEERYFTFTYSPIIAGSGAIPGVFCAVTETTDRVLGERRLLTLNALAAEVMDLHAPDDVVDAAVNVCASHAADLPFVAIYLREGESGEPMLRGTSPVAALGDSHLAGSASFWGFPDRLSEGAPVLQDLPDVLRSWLEKRDGPCPTQVALLPLSDAADAPRAGLLVVGLNPHRPFDAQYEGFCNLLADQLSAALTNARSHEFERQRAEALAELDRAKTTFLTNVSHEFRTPLTLMLSPLEGALARADGDPELSRQLETIRRSGERLLRLVNSLLDFARIEAGRSAPKLRPVDLGALTAQIASSFSEVCARGGVELVVDCDPAIASVDPEMWETIILNLVSNAFKFTLQGVITVAVAPPSADRVEVTITDTGSGIAAPDLRRLFERFYRAANAHARTAEGSGIGLAMVRNLVELQGGTIELESEPGRGTTVSIKLPAAELTESPAGARSAVEEGLAISNAFVAEAFQWLGEPVQTGPGQGERPLILVADDNADMRQHLRAILETRWRVECVSDGEAALEFIRREHPALLVTDVMMPTLDGFGLVSTIRADQDLADLPAIMLSARAGPEAAGEGFAAGADDYLVKPFSSRDLLNRVAARLEVAARDRTSAERREQSVQRLTVLSELGGALARAATVSDALDLLLESPLASLGATAVAVGLIEEGSDLIRVSYAGELPGEFRDRYHVLARDAPVPLAEVIRTNEPLRFGDTNQIDQRYEAVARDAAPAAQAELIEPLRASDGRLIGALSLSWAAPRAFEPAEAELAEGVAAVMAQAVERIEVSERDHRIATALQERLLDLKTRSTAAVVSATYEPAGELLRVGGDWYTAISLDDPAHVGVSVGDVVGHGLEGATAMSQLRSALGAAALTSLDPATVAELLDAYATRVPGAACSTVAYAVVDGNRGTLSYVCAGHPYPLLMAPDGSVSFLEAGRRPPLAARSLRRSCSSGQADFAPGSLLVLYTDGLIERRGESLDDGFRRLAENASACRNRPVGEVCATLVSAMAPPGGYPDDVAVVAVRPVGATRDSFVDALPATRGVVAPSRHRLREWLRSCSLEVDANLEYSVLLGVGEAVSNAIEHGSNLDEKRTVWIEGFVADGRITACVTDTGRWSTDSAASRRASRRGRGLKLIHGLGEDVQTTRSILGTRVVMSFSAEGSRDRISDGPGAI
jgi:signal transduction histidine kinase/FixJ family two-component response regulator